MEKVRHLTIEELEAGLPEICGSPKDKGELKLIVRRPGPGKREALPKAELDPAEGLIGDCWKTRGSSREPGRAPDPDTQLTLMNSRVIALLARSEDRWQLAGDQLFLDLDLSEENLPSGTRLALGSAVIEVTAKPHVGCKKLVEYFGPAAMKFLNLPAWRQLRLRGVNARVIKPGKVRAGDTVRKLTVK